MSNIVVSQINGGPTGVINAIINGNFGVNQRGVSGTVTLAAGVYGHDRWKAGASGCTYTFATVDNVTTLTISSGSLIQVIEGLNLGSGTYTLSWTGTAQGKIGAGSFSGSGVTGAAVGGTNLNIEFNTGTVSLVQFEQGSVATPFERRPYGTELALCQRYYQRIQGDATQSRSVGVGVVGTSAAAFRVLVPMKVSMRAAPTCTASGINAYDASAFPAVSLTTNYSTADQISIDAGSGSGLTVGRAATLLTNTVSTAYFDASAEL